MRAWSLDSLALAAYWLNDFSYSATLLCHALRCEGSSGDDEERCVYSHHLTCCLSMLAKHDHAFTIGRSIQVILKRHLGRLNEQAAGTRGWAAVPWGRGRWGGGGTGTFSWTRERQDRGAAMLMQAIGINLAVEGLHRVHLRYAISQCQLALRGLGLLPLDNTTYQEMIDVVQYVEGAAEFCAGCMSAIDMYNRRKGAEKRRLEAIDERFRIADMIGRFENAAVQNR